MRRKKAERALSGVLAGCMALCCAAPARAADDGVGIICDEAYYATTDYYGNLTEGSVVKSYVLNGATTLKDRGVYDEVLNLTDDTEPEIRGSALTFRLKEPQTHFYFEGKTARPFENLPWTISVHYALNGVPARAEELAGKTGVVEIAVDAVPNEAASEYARHNYVLAVNAAFNQDDILSLEAPGAQVQLVGNLRVALTLCLPGEEKHFAIRVGAEKFSFSGLTFLLMPATLSQLEQIAELSQRKDDIEDNYHKLAGSLDDLLDALEDVSGNLYGSAGGLDALNSARATVSAGKDEVYDKADALRADLDVINGELEPVTADLENLSDAVTDMNLTVRELTKKTTDLRTDLDTLSGLLKDAQGSKDELLDVFDSLAELEEELDDLQRRLGRTTLRTIPTVNRSDFPQVKGSVSGGLGTVNGLYSAYTENSNNGSMIQRGFATAALMIRDEITQSEAAAQLSNIQALAANYATARGGMDEDTAAATVAAAAGTTAATVKAAAQMAQRIAQVPAINSYTDFLKTLAAFVSTDDPSQAAMLTELANKYKENPYAPDALADKDGLGGNITGTAEEIDDGIQEAVSKTNNTIREVNSTITTLNGLMDPTADVVEALAELVDDTYALRPLVNTTDSLLELGKKDAEKCRGILDAVEALQVVLDTYEPMVQDALKNTTALVGSTRESLTHLGEFSDALKDLMQRSGEQLDGATKKSLANLAASLRSTAAALDKNEKVRTAKDAIEGIVEDVWDEHTGDIDNLLLMDTEAEIESLTSAHNPTPQSVQILIRTQEIEIPEEPAEDAAVPAKSVTFLDRVAQMFRDFWAAITGIFRR